MGGSGDDTYVVDARGDRVVEDVDAGTDTVHTDLAKYALGANVENLTFTDGSSHVGVGNVRANWIIGGTGNDWLDGRGGADKLEGGAGNDRYVVDAAGDEVIEAADAGIDKVIASVSHTLAANVENLTLSGAAAINGAGNAGRNIIIGNAADNVLVGLAGNDRLVGGAGDDVLRGGLGKDVLTGGAGVDWFVFDTVPDKATNLDKLTDFVSGTDVLLIGKVLNTAFTTVGAIGAEVFWSGAGVNTAHDATDRFIYNTSTGALWYDADGTGATAAVQVAVLTGAPALAFSDFLIAV
jgi:Ca2+-binding RTX toxin-like protein